MKPKKIIIFICIFLLIPIWSIADEYIEETSQICDNVLEVSNFDTNTVPSINARYGIVLDRASKTTLYGKNENTICKMASTTKIMTAIIVLEHCPNLNSEVIISKKAARHRRFTIRSFHK